MFKLLLFCILTIVDENESKANDNQNENDKITYDSKN